MKSDRQKLLAKIHIAAKQLNIPDDDGDEKNNKLSSYRSMLWTVTRQTSSAKLDLFDLRKVMHHLESRGFRAKRPVNKYPGKPHNLERDDQLKKIEALLADMGLPWSYADSTAKQMFKVERVAWLKDSHQKQAVITALTKKQKKAK